jgi:hypothetical protein
MSFSARPAHSVRGNPNLALAPRCGARTRAGCPCRAPAIRGKLRCRMHGGRSTGPRTAEGLARLRAARTIHGHYSAKTRARDRHLITVARRWRVGREARRYRAWLPPELAARLDRMAPELMVPPWPSGGLSRAEDRAMLRAEAEALAPWRLAIAAAKQAVRRPAEAKSNAGGTAAKALPEPHAPEPRPSAAAAQRGGMATAHAPEARQRRYPPVPPTPRPAVVPGAPRPHAPAPRSPRAANMRQRLLASTHHCTKAIFATWAVGWDAIAQVAATLASPPRFPP